MQDNIILGRKLTQEQVAKLPDGMKVYVKGEKSFWMPEGVYVVKENKLIAGDNKYILKQQVADFCLMFYEVCVLDEWVELTT